MAKEKCFSTNTYSLFDRHFVLMHIYMCVLVCVQVLYYFIVDMYVHCMCAFFPVSLTYPKAVPTAAGASIYDSERHSFNINTYKNT